MWRCFCSTAARSRPRSGSEARRPCTWPRRWAPRRSSRRCSHGATRGRGPAPAGTPSRPRGPRSARRLNCIGFGCPCKTLGHRRDAARAWRQGQHVVRGRIRLAAPAFCRRCQQCRGQRDVDGPWGTCRPPFRGRSVPAARRGAPRRCPDGRAVVAPRRPLRRSRRERPDAAAPRGALRASRGGLDAFAGAREPGCAGLSLWTHTFASGGDLQHVGGRRRLAPGPGRLPGALPPGPGTGRGRHQAWPPRLHAAAAAGGSARGPAGGLAAGPLIKLWADAVWRPRRGIPHSAA
mmetsp:Transcript_87591/g.281024  ORF Transcript_87591/g.281024 Transcript_87591/m.281024 type:complete len:292 (-) Transcript_87591:15-890(-)